MPKHIFYLFYWFSYRRTQQYYIGSTQNQRKSDSLHHYHHQHCRSQCQLPTLLSPLISSKAFYTAFFPFLEMPTTTVNYISYFLLWIYMNSSWVLQKNKMNIECQSIKPTSSFFYYTLFWIRILIFLCDYLQDKTSCRTILNLDSPCSPFIWFFRKLSQNPGGLSALNARALGT